MMRIVTQRMRGNTITAYYSDLKYQKRTPIMPFRFLWEINKVD